MKIRDLVAAVLVCLGLVGVQTATAGCNGPNCRSAEGPTGVPCQGPNCRLRDQPCSGPNCRSGAIPIEGTEKALVGKDRPHVIPAPPHLPQFVTRHG